MRKEIYEIPSAIAQIVSKPDADIIAAAKALRDADPALIITIARGSSDHAATFLKYAIEIETGVPVASLGPSVASIYEVDLRLRNAAAIAISQSGASPDIIAAGAMVKRAGALTLALTNQSQSPLGDAADHAINIRCGSELSVAATKSFVSSITAGLCLLAEWQGDDKLRNALRELPKFARQALDCDWSNLAHALQPDGSLFVLGRGPSWAIANEVALKFKETCSIHAEAYSAAEVIHGPMALVEKGFPLLTLCARDAAYDSCISTSEKLAGEGASAFITANDVSKSTPIGFVATGHPLTDALCLVIPFYVFVEAYARKLGLNPDQPPLLRKVTQTK
ncbi:MAG: SIS domain-containing protein [Devosiaceae bacterium]|nr:SIS domain-containing protein [Devosiaceae bacterium]